jgi:hypothetical protein
MTSLATQGSRSNSKSDTRVSVGRLAYFQTRLAGKFHQAMLEAFAQLEGKTKFPRKVLARRIGRSPEQITRWFSYPSNLTLSTASDVFIGMGYEIESITLLNLDTGERLQTPDHLSDWGRLAHWSAISLRTTSSDEAETQYRQAAVEQSRPSNTTLRRLGYETSNQHSAASAVFGSRPIFGETAASQLAGSRAANCRQLAGIAVP